MQPPRKDDNPVCHDPECEYNFPFIRPHVHSRTNDGGFVRFVIQKSNRKSIVREITDADTR